MAQVVAVKGPYGIETWADDGIQIITLDLSPVYDDELISQEEYDSVFKRKLNMIEIPEAREWIKKWIDENSYEEIKF